MLPGGTVARRHRPCARRLRGRSGARKASASKSMPPICWSTEPCICSATIITTTPTPPTWKRARSGRSRGSASPIPIEVERLMATQHDDEGGSRLWRGMRHLIFGDDSEPTLRDQIEEAIDEAEDSRPVAGDLTPVRAADAAQPAAFRRADRGRHLRHPRRHHRRALDDQLRGAGPRLRRRRPQPPAGLSARASMRSSAWSTSRTCSWPTSTRRATAR